MQEEVDIEGTEDIDEIISGIREMVSGFPCCCTLTFVVEETVADEECFMDKGFVTLYCLSIAERSPTGSFVVILPVPFAGTGPI